MNVGFPCWSLSLRLLSLARERNFCACNRLFSCSSWATGEKYDLTSVCFFLWWTGRELVKRRYLKKNLSMKGGVV